MSDVLHDWSTILQGATTVGVMVAIAWATLQRGTIQSLRGDNDDLRKRLDDRDATLAEQRTAHERERGEDRTAWERERGELMAKVADLDGAVKVLRDTVTGEAHLVALEGAVTDMATALNTHHVNAMAGVDRIEAAISGLGTTLGGSQ